MQGHDFTIAFWAYNNDDGERSVMFATTPTSGWGISIEKTTGNTLRVYWQANPDITISAFTLPVGEWTHIAETYTNNSLRVYKNGEKVYERLDTVLASNLTNTWSYASIGRDTRTGSTAFKGKLNDFRWYDHALSPREVKEISKGLVLHYPLSDPFIEETTNLITSEDCLSGTCYNASIKTYGYGTSTDMYKEVTMFDGRKGTKVYMGTNGNPAYPYVYVNSMYTSNGTNSPEYKTLSFDYYTTISTWIRPYKLGSGSGTATYKVINTTIKTGSDTDAVYIPVEPNMWNHIEITFHGTTDADAQWGYIQNYPQHTSDTSNFWFFANMQLEAKDHATGYTKYGTARNESIVYDVSGYQRNGTKIGTIIVDTDTPRYWTSSYFNGGDNAISVPFNTVIPDSTTPFTINLWFKKTELGTDGYETLFGGPSGFEMDTRSGNSTTLSLYMASTRGGHIYSPLNLNEWYMVSLASDRTNEYYYVNGELVKTIEAKPMPTGSYFIGAWRGASEQNIKGYISDFRIYATALSAEDILALYNNPVSLSSNGALLTQGEVTE